MLARSIQICFVLAASIFFATGQIPDAKNEPVRPVETKIPEKSRDLSMARGVSLKFLISELARNLDLNVLFDDHSRLDYRSVRIDLRNVTTSDALKYVLLQEGLYSEEVGPKTILVGSRIRALSVPQLGFNSAPMSAQLAAYFGATGGGVLVNYVRDNSPALKAGLRAGDVIVAIDNKPVGGALSLMNAIDSKPGGSFTLKVIRERNEVSMLVRLPEK